MFIYILVYTQKICNLPNYPSILSSEDSTLLISMNKNGMQNYLQCAVKQAPKLMNKTQLPNLAFNLEIEEDFPIDFNFTNISLAKINAETSIDIKSKGFDFHNTDITFLFNWNMRETTYPYVSDKGHGEIVITGSDLHIDLNIEQDTQCLGDIAGQVKNVQFNAKNINVGIYGGTSWIFQSILISLVDSLNDKLSNVIADFMKEAVILYVDSLVSSQQNYYQYPMYLNIIKDDRFTQNIQVELNQLVFMKSGYTFSLNNLSDQFINQQMINALPIIKNKKQVEYTISKAALNNFLYIFHTYNNIYTNPSVFTVLEAPTMDLVNMNHVTLNMKIKMQNAESQLQLKGVPILRHHTDQIDLSSIYFEFETEPEFVEVANWINKQIYESGYLIRNDVFPLDSFSVVIDADNDCIKIVGDIADCL
ncbi:Conserved_hypothetical protein [Hexamita inflata]|uniref:Uncharacterized protein n=1 Tax=Hexamita inflata TaxID=28002 RepID=A0AA86N9H5_9EUKA|nr:Conserved hypothetical protein [Hexamita inflata]